MTEQRKMFEEWVKDSGFEKFHESMFAAWQACLAATPAPQHGISVDELVESLKQRHPGFDAAMSRASADLEHGRAMREGRAPQRVAVPDAMKRSPNSYGYEEGYVAGWNACREAMISAAPQPDGVGGVPTLTDDELWDIRNHVAIHEVTRDDDSKTICVKHGRAVLRALLAKVV